MKILRLIGVPGNPTRRLEKGHGRLQRRHILTSPDLNEFLRRDWGEVGQLFRLPRERKTPGASSVEIVSGWTSLSPQRCPPKRLFQLIRDHWAVENRLHWRRDATRGEDRCGVRVPSVAQMLAVLKTLVLSLMDLHQISHVARQIRRFSSHPNEALAWLLYPWLLRLLPSPDAGITSATSGSV